ncbi:glycosyltransferase family 4 protein [Bacteroidaceae bacterium HV4-6-C5C]|nr:glycosyltransferase family 4 protein [Bacteroidaceae bacterium HV4-6-C5C]
MKNILHVVNISFVIPYFLGDQLLYFTQKGYREFIICSPSSELVRFSEKYNFKYQEVEILRKISVWKDIQAVYATIKFIKRNNIDIVTGHTPKGALIAMFAAYLMRVPIRVYFRHGLVYETSTGIKRKLLIIIDRLAAKMATKIVCVSSSVSIKSIEDNLNKASKQYLLSKGTCNGIDIERFCKENIEEQFLIELRKKLGLKNSNFVIGFTGRLVRDKGIIELIFAFQKLQEKYSNMILLLVGVLEKRDALPQNVITYIKNNSNIIYTGYIPNSIIQNYYALMDVFVFPSYREGFGTSTLEASAMNLPIITARVTGCIDSIIENQTGLFVDHNPESIAVAIEYFYSNTDIRFIYGKNGRKFVVENFEQHIVWSEIEKLYVV